MLSIPPVAPAILTAALQYAEAGWYVLPIDPRTKHPGSILGKRWQEQSSRDAQQIAAWFAGSSDGLALHVGRSGAVVFDVDNPGEIPVSIAVAISAHLPPFQSTRTIDATRGHYVFRQPPGRSLGNSAGKLGRAWGDVRGLNGIIVVQPTAHAKPDGQYRWIRTGEVPELPAELAALLPDAAPGEDSATDAQIEAFLDRHNRGDRLDLIHGLVTQYEQGVAGGHGRHTTAVSVACEAAREAVAGQYPARPALDALREVFARSLAGERSWQAEWRGILAWAIGQAPLTRENALSATQSAEPGSGDTSGTTKRRLRLVRASTVRPGRVRWGWSERFPLGELTLIPGREGIGKSLFLAWLAAQLTTGQLPGEFAGAPRSVLYAASEDSWRYTIVPRMLAAGADLDLVYRVEIEDAGRLVLPLDCMAIPDAAHEVKAAALMLDPIVSLLDDAISVNQSRELRRALEPLRDAAERAEIMVPALVHFNKQQDGDVLSKIPGGRAWAEVARAAFGLAADDDTGEFVGSQIKNNLGRVDLPNLAYLIEGKTIDTDDGPTSVGVLRWTGETNTSVAEALERKTDRPLSDRASAILAFLERTEVPSALDDVYAQFPLMDQATVRQTLARLKSKGLARSPRRGVWMARDRTTDSDVATD